MERCNGRPAGGVIPLMAHEGSIPRDVIDAVVRRRGRVHCFENIDPARTAFVVIDMQNAFVHPGYGPAYCAAAAGIIPAVNQLASVLRARGGRVFWIRTTHGPSCRKDWSVLYDHIIPNTGDARVAALSLDAPGHALVEGLDIDPADDVVEKYRYSAFLPAASDLAQRLASEGLDTVIIGGTVTNICCESSARDAMMMNFKTIMVSDANAAKDDATHWASLSSFYSGFGDVMTVAEIVQRLECA